MLCLLVMGYLVLPAAGGWIANRGVSAVSQATVWLVVSMADGVSLWALLAGLASRLGGLLGSPVATAVLVGVEVLGLVALYGLQRAVRTRTPREPGQRHEEE